MDTSRTLRWLLPAAVALGLASCSGRLPSEPGVGTVEPPANAAPVSYSLLEASQARWSASHVSSYQYRFRWECFCSQDHVRIVDINVTGGVITRVTDVETGARLTEQEAASYRTIDGLFDFVRGALDQSAASVNGAFDPSLGYPSVVNVDYVANIADDENGFRIYSLRVR